MRVTTLATVSIWPNSTVPPHVKKNLGSNDTLAVRVISQNAETVENSVPRRPAPETQASEQLFVNHHTTPEMRKPQTRV